MSKAIISRRTPDGNFLCVYPNTPSVNIEDLGLSLCSRYNEKNIEKLFKDGFVMQRNLYESMLEDVNKFEWEGDWFFKRKANIINLNKIFKTKKSL